MATNLEILRDRYDLATTGGEVVIVFLPKFALEAIKGTYHRLRYELDQIEDPDTRDEIEEWLDAGQFGLEDEMLVQDLLDQMVIMNGHLATANSHMANMAGALSSGMIDAGGTIGLTDAVLSVGGAGGAWDDLEIGDLITAVEVIGAAL